MGYARYEDMVVAGTEITSLTDWKVVMKGLADAAAAEQRYMNAAFYYRAAELYTPWNDPKKQMLYDRFIELFYLAFGDNGLDIIDIPHVGTFLSVMRMPYDGGNHKGTIILHGGYDSYKEELYSIMRYLSAGGYDVINFDVPWMNRARKSDVSGFDYAWEKLVKVVLDYFELDDATIFGISYGGWLCIRAAAFEPRIKRVVASSVSFDVNQYVGGISQGFVRFMRTKMPEMTNKQIIKQMEEDSQSAWFFDHLMHVTNKATPLEAANVLAEINEENLHSDFVTQDVLILTGEEDHLVPFKMHKLQVNALRNAASVTPMVFTSEVHGQNHCQVGNIGLALNVAIEWLERMR